MNKTANKKKNPTLLLSYLKDFKILLLKKRSKAG